jgi:predicted ATP-dependent serine protease
MELDKSRFEELQKHFDQTNIFSRVHLPCHMVPFGKNKRFFGRSTQLRRMASSAIGSSEQVQRVIVIQGLGGVGKSEVALQFMHDHLADFPAIFWISAEGEGKIAQSYVDIARCLRLDNGDFQVNQKRGFEAVTQWLSSTGQSASQQRRINNHLSPKANI